MTRTPWAPRREVQLWVALQQVFWGLEFWHGHRSPQLSPGSRPIFQKLEERVTLNHFSVCAGQYYAWLIALGMVAYYSSLLLHCYILLVTELFSFPVPGQSWNRLWMCVGQGEGKLRVTVSLHSGAFSFSIKLAAFRLPVGLAFFSLVYYFQRRECIWQSENSTSLNTDGRDYTTLSPDLQKPAVSFQGFSSLTGGLAFVNYFH